jgi:hypothetical protein
VIGEQIVSKNQRGHADIDVVFGKRQHSFDVRRQCIIGGGGTVQRGCGASAQDKHGDNCRALLRHHCRLSVRYAFSISPA